MHRLAFGVSAQTYGPGACMLRAGETANSVSDFSLGVAAQGIVFTDLFLTYILRVAGTLNKQETNSIEM